jgi:hypothetical protein
MLMVQQDSSSGQVIACQQPCAVSSKSCVRLAGHVLLLLQALYDVWRIALSAGVGPRRKPRAGSNEVSNMQGRGSRSSITPCAIGVGCAPPGAEPYSRLWAASACSSCTAAESAGSRHMQAQW